MQIELPYSKKRAATLFFGLTRPKDVAEMLMVPHKSLVYWIYRTPERRRYTTIHIPKKSGGTREILAPNPNIKILQQKLNYILQSVYHPKPSAHGFSLARSVRTNAEPHVGKKWIFNVDLRDFFHWINFGRVRGMFMGPPYHVPQKPATILAHLCCHHGHLPQGAPTSPIVSNMICAQMDSHLQTLAQSNQATYTRYADDITFSTTRRNFPAPIATFDPLGQIQPGDALTSIIEKNGFSINSDKIWLSGRHRRQVVTGITVNDFPNVPRRHLNQIRAMLHAWKTYGLAAAQEEWIKKYYTPGGAGWQQPPDFSRVLQGKIEYVGMIRGLDAPVYLRLCDRLNELEPTLATKRGTPLRMLRTRYDFLVSTEKVTQQARGLRFELVLTKLFEISRIPVVQPFRRNRGGEQIDGAFTLDNHHYLLECKWTSGAVGQSTVDALCAKVGRSGDQTMGVFVSVNGWSDHVLDLLKQNPEKRVFLANGQDISAVLSGSIDFNDLLRAKIQALNLKSEPFLSVNAVQ